jgi:hypothetical protein
MRCLHLINTYEIILNSIDIMGDPWVPVTRMGMGLGTKLNP